MRRLSMLLVVLSLSLAGGCGESEPAGSSTAEPTSVGGTALGTRIVPLEGTLQEGWTQTIRLPETTLASEDDLVLSIKHGLLWVRRESDGQLDWQIALCRFQPGQLPVVRVRSGMPYLEVKYEDGRYFVRESVGYVRSLRESLDDATLDLGKEIFGDDVIARSSAGSAASPRRTSMWESDGWYFVATGPDDQAWDAVVRLHPKENIKKGFGVMTTFGHMHQYCDDDWLIDDGELLVASRTLPALYRATQRMEKARKDVSAPKFPPLETTEWFNTETKPSWDTLRGKVVLVDFWGTWCQPCVEKLPDLQALHEQYADRGLAIVAIHSQQDSDTCAEFLRERGYTFPVALDTGKTAESFGIESWPSYFLIDRKGKLAQGYLNQAPTAAAIEVLLQEAPAD